MKRRTILSLALVATVALGACGGSDDPAVLQISATGDGRDAAKMSAEAAAGGTADVAGTSRIAPAYLTYEWAGGDLPAGGQGRAYRLVPADREAVAELAAFLGVTGEVVEQDGSFVVGPQDASAPSVWVGTTGLPYFSYSDPTVISSAVACPVPMPEPAPAAAEDAAAREAASGGAASGDGASGEGSTGDAKAAIEPAVDPAVECAEPAPLQGLPSADEARARALDLLRGAGMDVDGADVTVDGGDYGMWVTVTPKVDGIAVTDLSGSVGFGEGGAVTYAAGWLGHLEQGDEYPTVSGQEALDFLTTGELWGPQLTARDIAAEPAAGTETTAPAETAAPPETAAPAETVLDPTTPETSSPEASGSEQSASEQSTPETSSIETTPAPDTPVASVEPGVDVVEPVPPQPEPVVIRLTGVRPGLQFFLDAGGTGWLLPAYVFTSDDGGQWNVLAVQRQYLEVPEPAAG